MFGIDGPEFLVIVLVLIVVVGPKDLPKMMRAFGKVMARVRTTSSEFRQQFDDAMREAELEDLQKSLSDVGNLDPRKKMTEIFDPLRDIAKDIKGSLDVDKAEQKAPVNNKGDNQVKIIPGVNPELDAIVDMPRVASTTDGASSSPVKKATVRKSAGKKETGKLSVSHKATAGENKKSVAAQSDKKMTIKSTAAEKVREGKTK